jgi:CDP-diacylglycerol--glycerol-3-phosphate 3-phosphatidyltransferase
MWNLPNQLTVFRLGLCVVLTFLFEVKAPWGGLAALGVFVAASLTDWLDGYIARRYHLITDLGKLLDPLADKILISVAYIGFVALGLCPLWVVVGIIAREFLITGLRVLAAAKGVILPAERIGKHKTISQMVGALVGLVLYAMIQMGWWESIALRLVDLLLKPLFYFALVITVYSGLAYFMKNIKLVSGEEGGT